MEPGFVPGASHKKQARAMFAGELLWVLEEKRCVGLEPHSGAVQEDMAGRPRPTVFRRWPRRDTCSPAKWT